MTARAVFRKYWWVVMLAVGLVRLLEYYGLDPLAPLQGFRQRTDAATAYVQTRLDEIRPGVVASTFYGRLGDCRYDWRTVCLCSVRYEPVHAPLGHPLTRSSPWDRPWSSLPLFPTVRPVPHPPGCQRAEPMAPFAWLEGFKGGWPGLAAGTLAKAPGLRDAVMHTGTLIASQGAVAWVVGGVTALIAILFVVGMLIEASERGTDEVLQAALVALVALFVLPGLVALLAGALKVVMTLTVLILGTVLAWSLYALMGVVGLLATLGRISEVPEGAKDIVAAGRHVMRRLRRRKAAVTPVAQATTPPS